MFQLDTSHNIAIGKNLVMLTLIVIGIILLYFFSFQIQVILSTVLTNLSKKIGTYSVTKEYALQRYVYQHRNSLLAKLYMWVNEQLIALGLKRQGVTAVGYLLFWALMALIIGITINLVLGLNVFFAPLLVCILFICLLIMTRVMVSERMEKREADVMNAIDLIVPEVKNGVKNAIITYKDNFAPSLREDFAAFITNIQDRGYTFPDAMYILADNLGLVFYDFAQKAIYYEAVGEKEMLDIFSDITETNRLRRQLRDENQSAFANLKAQFFISTLMTGGYFIFLMITDDFSREFFLQNPVGQFLLICMLLVVFGVLSYITTIKSQAI
jgi:Flp pilus assembly protein TadB